MSDQPPAKEKTLSAIIGIKSGNTFSSDGFWLHIIKYLKQRSLGSQKYRREKKDVTVFFVKFMHKHTFGWGIT